MRVQCSNCGTIKGFTYIEKNVNKVIYEGWRSYLLQKMCRHFGR
ncbi:MAG: hypothetical protein RSB70_03620 [Clostridium sp.]